jgi:hypothetical protein
VVDKAFKFLLKVAVLVWLAQYLLSQLHSVRIDNYIVPILLLALCLVLLKRWFPPLYGFLKRIAAWTGKAIAGWLWYKPERKGGASMRQPRMRWRQ